ncbi:hypothetical protein Y032_0096g2911 [Ancylostoma ceylanicum]|uniref:Uncharacterized protein n=1 Tax=Ancylostoma ceylanicum TaxID=53326 RepID=A0A016TJC9_9BILA|nr:hypothetical protein Y032_0096g2911 [Ancylostoma ceylanicum]
MARALRLFGAPSQRACWIGTRRKTDTSCSPPTREVQRTTRIPAPRSCPLSTAVWSSMCLRRRRSSGIMVTVF